MVAIVVMPYIIWKSFVRHFHYGGFVHIVPKAVDAQLDQVAVECAPPGADAGGRKVGKAALSRPHGPAKGLAVGVLDQHIACQRFLKRPESTGWGSDPVLPLE